MDDRSVETNKNLIFLRTEAQNLLWLLNQPHITSLDWWKKMSKSLASLERWSQKTRAEDIEPLVPDMLKELN